jgi:predicted RNA-binding protein with PIN domain
MTYLIDGHNLIPHVAGLSLDQFDDEERLITLLVSFSIKHNCQIEVYFDRGQLSNERDLRRGRVHVHFILSPMIADSAILARLLGIGNAAKNYIVVTSDQNVQNQSRRIGAKIISSQNFAQLLINIGNKNNPTHQGQKPVNNEKEIDEWMKLFSRGQSEPPKT